MDAEERKKFYKSNAWQVTRQLVLERDNYECVECRKNGKVFTDKHRPDKHKRLDIDHIKSLEHHPHLAFELDNLQTLCIRCHNIKENRFSPMQKKKKVWNDEMW